MKNPYIYLLKASWKYALGERKTMFFIYLLFAIVNIITTLKPLLFGWFVNALQSNTENLNSVVWRYSQAFMGVFFLGWVFQGPARFIERKLAFNISRNFLDDIFRMLLKLPVEWHQFNHTGGTINRLYKAQNSLRTFFQNGFSYLQVLLQFVISLGGIVYFSPIFGTISLIAGILVTIVIIYYDRPYTNALRKINEGDNNISSTLSDNLKNIVTILILKLENQVHSQLISKMNSYYEHFKRSTYIGELRRFSSGIIIDISYCIIIIGFVYMNYRPGEKFNIGNLIILCGFIDAFATVFFSMTHSYNQISQFSTDVKMTDNIVSAYSIYKKNWNEKTILDDWRQIKINEMLFSYSRGCHENNCKNNTPGQLQDINIVINRGDKIAVIGKSGSGKSTLLAVLKGLYSTTDDVKLSVDEVGEYDLHGISNLISLFPQQPEIFANTVKYNITMGLEYSDEEVTTACNLTCFSEVLDGIPGGMDAIINENGVNLSGGQKQRLALARGLLGSSEKSILLLDESTSNIDQHTEAIIYENLFKTFIDKTIICTVHRQNLLVHFDYIYLLENGKIAHEGNYASISKHLLIH